MKINITLKGIILTFFIVLASINVILFFEGKVDEQTLRTMFNVIINSNFSILNKGIMIFTIGFGFVFTVIVPFIIISFFFDKSKKEIEIEKATKEIEDKYKRNRLVNRLKRLKGR